MNNQQRPDVDVDLDAVRAGRGERSGPSVFSPEGAQALLARDLEIVCSGKLTKSHELTHVAWVRSRPLIPGGGGNEYVVDDEPTSAEDPRAHELTSDDVRGRYNLRCSHPGCEVHAQVRAENVQSKFEKWVSLGQRSIELSNLDLLSAM